MVKAYEGARLVSLNLFDERLLQSVRDAEVLLEELRALCPPRVVPTHWPQKTSVVERLHK
jgi:hypothetical protein